MVQNSFGNSGPFTTAALPLPVLPDEGPRSILLLHRDVWRTIERAPLLLLGLPALLHLPLDLISLAAGIGEEEPLRAGLRTLGLAVGGTGLTFYAYLLASVGAHVLGRDGKLSASVMFKETNQNLWAYSVAMTHLMVRTVLGFMLLVLPGIAMVLNYSLAVPALLIDGKRGAAALRESSLTIHGRKGLGYGFTILMMGMYFIPSMLMSMTGQALHPVVGLVTAILFNMLTATSGIADVLLYVELKDRRDMFIPVGRRATGEALQRQLSSSPWPVFLVAAALSVSVGASSAAYLGAAAASAFDGALDAEVRPADEADAAPTSCGAEE